MPLPFPGLDSVNAYLLADDEGATLVDCGMHDPSEPDGGWPVIVAALEACDVDVASIVRLVVTHTHIDHYGMAARVVGEAGCELWMHEDSHEDLDVYLDPAASTGRLAELLADHGVPTAEVDELVAFEDWRPFVAGVVAPTHPCGGGEMFEARGRSWQVVPTPGHARSHICLFAPGDRLLISGDHLLPTVTPHIDFERDRGDPLGDFLTSLEKIEELDPALVLPGHGRPFEEGAERARVVARHHDRRLGSILQVIRREPRSANEIVDEIFGTELLNFDRRLALGEALAHLAYLRRRGEVERLETDGTFRYRKSGRRRRPRDDE